MKAYAVANIEGRGRMADEALFTRASSVGKWKGDVAKKYDFCLSRRSGAYGVGSVMSTTSGNYTLFAGLERTCHAVRFSVWLAQIGRSGAGQTISTPNKRFITGGTADTT